MKLEKIDHICFAVKDLEGFFKYQVSSIQHPVSGIVRSRRFNLYSKKLSDKLSD